MNGGGCQVPLPCNDNGSQLPTENSSDGSTSQAGTPSRHDEPSFITNILDFSVSLFDDFGEHGHAIRSFACNVTIQSGCSQANLFENGLLYANAPTGFLMVVFGDGARDEPVVNGEINYAWPVGWVRTFVDRESFSIINVTTRNHTLHPGTVIRQIVREGNNIFIETRGYGFGVGSHINDFLAPAAWEGVNQAVINRAGIYPRTRL